MVFVDPCVLQRHSCVRLCGHLCIVQAHMSEVNSSMHTTPPSMKCHSYRANYKTLTAYYFPVKLFVRIFAFIE